jgi:hypothetical protein
VFSGTLHGNRKCGSDKSSNTKTKIIDLEKKTNKIKNTKAVK